VCAYVEDDGDAAWAMANDACDALTRSYPKTYW
jgi:hypothetical protein